ncbi:MAG: hypothetical protein Kow00106_02080 [Anaerolineae bacterium]
MKNIMNQVPNPLSGEIWRRGSVLGLRWLALFCVASVGSYAALGVLGWSGIARALCAMGAGPLIGTAIIGLWWLVRRPSLSSEWPTSSDDGEAQAGGS